jgi:hypothetical protein
MGGNVVFPMDVSHAVTLVLPTFVALKPPMLRRLNAKTNDKYPNHDENQVALGLRRAAHIAVPRPLWVS